MTAGSLVRAFNVAVWLVAIAMLSPIVYTLAAKVVEIIDVMIDPVGTP